MSKRKLASSYSTLRRQVRAQVHADLCSVAADDCSNVDDDESGDEFLTTNSTASMADVEFVPNISLCDPIHIHLSDDSYEGDDNAGDHNNHPPQCDLQSSDFSDCHWVGSDTDSEDTDCDEESDLVGQINEWANKYAIPHVAVTELMHVLKPHLPALPNCARTLLCTPRNCSVKQLKNGGEYCHLGLAKGLQEMLISGTNTVVQTTCLKLQFNVDGVPLFKSSNLALWPILCRIKNADKSEPFVVGIYCGNEKPADATEFLAEFVAEASDLADNGISICGEINRVEIHSFVCDAPARAFVKGIKCPSGYSACEKCTEHGDYQNKVIYRHTDAPLRTNIAFDEMADENHHVGPCPLKPLKVGCVSQFGLDYMHLVCLGVVRRLLLYWKGPVGPLCARLGRRDVDRLSQKLVLLCPNIPSDFVRKPRSVSEVMRWKATEFRQFLLYTGPVVLQDILSEKMYHHFMLLSVAVRILACPKFALSFCDYAHELLVLFVNEAEQLYGNEIYVYNVHCLIHLANDVRNLGALDEFSAFTFENKLGQLKKMIRKPQYPIQQIVYRLTEKQKSKSVICDQANENLSVKYEHSTGPVLAQYRSYRQYRCLHAKNCNISLSQGNNCILTTEGYPTVVQNILSPSADDIEQVLLMCQSFVTAEDAFSHPLPSSRLGIYKVSNKLTQLFVLPLCSVANKCTLLPVKDSFVVFPLLH